MAKLALKAGTTSKMIPIFVQLNNVTTGAGKTGLSSASTNLKWVYYREGAGTGATAVTLAASTLGTFTSGAFKEIDATNAPGLYELGVPDAAIAAGAKWVSMYIWEITTTALNIAPVTIEIDLVAYDPYDTVRLGLTAMPNMASGSAGAIVTSGTGTAQVSTSSGQVILQTGTGTGQLDFTGGIVKANAVQLLGTAWLTPGTAGTPDVNAKLIGGTAQTGFDVAGRAQTALPNAAAGAANGLVIAGTNAPIVFTGSGSAMTLLSTGANGSGLAAAGNGSGAAILALGGSTSGEGMKLAGGGTGQGLYVIGAGSGAGFQASGGTTGDGMYCLGGGTSNHGLKVSRGGASGDDLNFANADCTVPRVTLTDTVTTYTGNTLQTGDAYAQLLLRAPYKIWFVATTGNDSNAGSQDSPFLTIGAAVTACRSGDTIFVKNGTYTETVNLDSANKFGVTLIGESRISTILTATVTSFAGVVTMEHGTKIKRMTVQTATADGTGITGLFDKHDIEIDEVTCTGKWDGALVAYASFNPRGLRIRNSYFEGTYDALNIGGCQDFIIENCYFKTTGDYPPIYDTSCVRMATSTTQGTFRNCTFEVAHGSGSAGTAKKGSCVVLSGADSHVVFDGCSFKGRKTSATDSGALRGIGSDETTPLAFNCHIRNCRFDLSSSGSGAVYDIDASPTSTTVTIDAATFTAAKLNGVANIRTDLVPTTAARTLDVTATGGAGIDWANVESPTTTLALSGTSTKALEPTTAGRTLDVTATGAAGVDWGNVENKTTTNALTATTISTAEMADAVWDEVRSPGHTTAGTFGKYLDAQVSSVSGGGGGSGGPVEHTPVPSSRILQVRNRRDGTFGVIGSVYMKAGETLWWAIDLKGTQLALGNLINSVSAPTVTGAQSANLTVADYGVLATLVKFECVLASGALTTDTINVQITITPTGTESLIVVVPVVVGT